METIFCSACVFRGSAMHRVKVKLGTFYFWVWWLSGETFGIIEVSFAFVMTLQNLDRKERCSPIKIVFVQRKISTQIAIPNHEASIIQAQIFRNFNLWYGF